MCEELMEQAARALDLARQHGAGDAVAHMSDTQSTQFAYRDGKLEQVEQSASRRLSVELYAEGRYSGHTTTDLRPESLQRFIADAVALTRHLEPDPHRLIPDPELYQGRADVDLDLVDPAVPALARDTCLDWLRAMDEATHADPRVISATSSTSFGWRASAQLSSNGFEGARRGTSIGYGSTVALDEGEGRRPEAYRYVNSRHLEDLPAPAAVAGEGLQRALARLGSRKLSSARTVMVVDPEAGGGLLGHALEALSAGAIQQNRSFLADQKDRSIASAKLTIIDEPLQRRGLGSRLYDGEGIASRPLPIFEAGVLRNFYVDTYYGHKLGWSPTTGSPSNLVFEPGDQGLEELIAGVGEGFYVNGWLGGNADSTTGDFSFGFQGHRIEQGRKGEPVSEMNITGNFLSLLANLMAVGNDPDPWSSFCTPTLVFDQVEFSGQ